MVLCTIKIGRGGCNGNVVWVHVAISMHWNEASIMLIIEISFPINSEQASESLSPSLLLTCFCCRQRHWTLWTCVCLKIKACISVWLYCWKLKLQRTYFSTYSCYSTDTPSGSDRPIGILRSSPPSLPLPLSVSVFWAICSEQQPQQRNSGDAVWFQQDQSCFSHHSCQWERYRSCKQTRSGHTHKPEHKEKHSVHTLDLRAEIHHCKCFWCCGTFLRGKVNSESQVARQFVFGQKNVSSLSQRWIFWLLSDVS